MSAVTDTAVLITNAILETIDQFRSSRKKRLQMVSWSKGGTMLMESLWYSNAKYMVSNLQMSFKNLLGP